MAASIVDLIKSVPRRIGNLVEGVQNIGRRSSDPITMANPQPTLSPQSSIDDLVDAYVAANPGTSRVNRTAQATNIPQNVQRNTAPHPSTADFQRPNPQSVESAILQGLREYSGGNALPIEEFIPMFVQATQDYPVFAQHPFLLPQISILETSGGRNVTRENNPLNWGARLQAQGLYNPQTPEEAIMAAITAIGGAPDRGRSASYYEPFRQSMDPLEFAQIYEPANPSYGRNLVAGMDLFNQFYQP